MYRKIKLKVPVEAFPPNANVMGILLGHKGASHKKLEELTGCSIEIYKDNTDSQIQGMPTESFKKILPNDKIYLLVGYTDPTQLEKLEDLLFQIAEKATQLLLTTGTINLKSIFDHGMLKRNEYKKDIKSEHTHNLENSWTTYPSENVSLRHQADTLRTSESDIINYSSTIEDDKLKPIRNLNTKNKQISTNPQINHIPTTHNQHSFDPDEVSYLWKFHKLLTHFKFIKESEVKIKFLNYYKAEGTSMEKMKIKFEKLEQRLYEFGHLFKFDPETRCFISNLPTTITERDFNEFIVANKYNTSNATNESYNDNLLKNVPNSEHPSQTNFDNLDKNSIYSSNLPIQSRINPLIKGKHNFTSMNLKNINKELYLVENSSSIQDLNSFIESSYQSNFNNLSFTLQLIHRSLVKASQPILLEQIESRFEHDWCRIIDFKDLNASSIKELLFKHENIFNIHQGPDNDKFYISPTHRPSFEPILL